MRLLILSYLYRMYLERVSINQNNSATFYNLVIYSFQYRIPQKPTKIQKMKSENGGEHAEFKEEEI